jgi:dUTP pyrophosphatase
MPVLSGNSLADKGVIIPYDDNAVQSGGYDLHIEKVTVQNTHPIPYITKDNDKRIVSDWKELTPHYNNIFRLERGEYLIEFSEIVTIPPDCIGLIFPRSSLLRSNCTMTSAVWDAGYSGKGKGYLIVNSHVGVYIEQYAAICQLVLFGLDTVAENLYKGKYQYEGLHNDTN